MIWLLTIGRVVLVFFITAAVFTTWSVYCVCIWMLQYSFGLWCYSLTAFYNNFYPSAVLVVAMVGTDIASQVTAIYIRQSRGVSLNYRDNFVDIQPNLAKAEL